MLPVTAPLIPIIAILAAITQENTTVHYVHPFAGVDHIGVHRGVVRVFSMIACRKTFMPTDKLICPKSVPDKPTTPGIIQKPLYTLKKGLFVYLAQDQNGQNRSSGSKELENPRKYSIKLEIY